MADYSTFKNSNGDDLVLQDSRVGAISEKVEGIEAGAEVNKIESISIDNTELEPDKNKNIVIQLGDGLKFVDNELCASTGTGGIVLEEGVIDIICKSPLRNSCGDNPCVELAYDNTLTKIDYSDDPETPDEKLSVKTPLPAPASDHSDRGKVLTVDNSDEIVWAAPQGGGGGNPYTKVTVTPGNPYDTGKTHEIEPLWVVPLYDQDVIIENNTYSILSTDIGYCFNQYDEETPIDTFNIRLPAGTDFPMAVVEFKVDSKEGSSVNNINVFVGETKLTRMFDTPYISNPVKYEVDTDPNWSSNIGPFVLKDNYDQTKKYLAQMDDVNLGGEDTAFPYSNRVQVYIFGNCYKVSTNWPNERPVYAFPQS